MRDSRNSDSPVVPSRSPKDAGPPGEEAIQRSGLNEGDARRQNAFSPRRTSAPSALERVRQAPIWHRKNRFTALLYDVYGAARLRAARFGLKDDAAPAAGGESWWHDEQPAGTRVQELSEWLQRGAYRAKPVRRVYILKADPRQQRLGAPSYRF